ncbi:response regulator [Glaciecola sp. 2405UD65-10]|uniref:response regulator n=1 Tax=Glaciecola sp. 2405UD65-10 TaxID=3397244 RepID=UPI003B5B9277
MTTLDYSNKRCLIVEDRRPFLMLMRGLVNSLGATKVTTELSAESAIKICKSVKFDIIICDLHLGNNRKNGFEFLEEIRKLHLIRPSTVFIMVSGDSTRSMVLGSLEKQPDDYLIKPFSQAQLNARVSRAISRRIALSALYSQIDHQKYALSIETCKHFLATEPRYKNHLLQIIVQLFWKTEQYDDAQQILASILKQREVQWALCSMAKTLLLKGLYEDAINTAKRAIDTSKNNVEAYDILADAYLQYNKKPEALKFIQEALSLSPLSINRHFRVCEIARENGDYELAMQSAKSIFDLSKRSVHKNITHMCGYVRSILDLAEHTEDSSAQNKYMQDSLMALHKAKSEENLRSQLDDFDYDIFEKLVHSRMLFIEDKPSEAKQILEESQVEIEKTFTEYPVALAADSLKVMIDLCDFEEAHKLSKIILSNPDKVDNSIIYLAENAGVKTQAKRKEYIQLNKVGIKAYSEAKFKDAYDLFTSARKIAPLNIGVSLNLLQCLCKLINTATKVEGKYIVEARELYRFITSLPLKNTHRAKFETMKLEVETLIDE